MLSFWFTVAALVDFSKAVDLTPGFTVGRTYRPRVIAKASPDDYTDNVITLQRGSIASLSSTFLHGVRKGADIDGVYTRVPVCFDMPGM